MINQSNIERVARLLGEAIDAEKVLLFGSYAKEKSTNNSDVDLLIIADTDLPKFKRARSLYKLIKPYPFGMDILVYTPREIDLAKKSPLSFISRILKEGKPVYVRGN